MTNRVQIYEFYKKVKLEENFIFQVTVLKFSNLLGGWKLATNAKFQKNISKLMPARPKNTGKWGLNATVIDTRV